MFDPESEYSDKYPGVPGLSLTDAKKILSTRRSAFDEHITLSAPMIALGCDSFSADRHLHALSEAGYLVHDSHLPLTRHNDPLSVAETDADRLQAMLTPIDAERAVQKGVPHWYLTPVAQQLCVQKLLKRMSRQEAEKLLGRVLDEVRAINLDPNELMRITRVRMFGSMLDDSRDSYGDLDLHITQSPDLNIEGAARAELVRALSEEGYRTGGFIARYAKPERAARARSEERNRMRLGKLGRRVSLSSQSPDELGVASVDVFAYDLTTCSEIAEISENWRGKAEKLRALELPAEGPHKGKTLGIATIASPRVVPAKSLQPEALWARKPIRSRRVALETAELMAVQPGDPRPCPECGGMWCAHRTDIGVADVEEGSNAHCLLDLEISLRETPMGHPIVEMRRSLAILKSIAEESDAHMYDVIYRGIDFIALEKGGIQFGGTLWQASRVYRNSPFAIKAGTFDLILHLGASKSTEGFVAYMRLAQALRTLWGACAFSGGGSAGVVLDLADPDLDDLTISRLACVGKLARAARPTIKSLEKSPPFAEDYAAARKSAISEYGAFRPGSFSIHAMLDPKAIDVSVSCSVYKPVTGGDYADAISLGQDDGKDPETRDARDDLVAAILPIARDLRSLPGFVQAEAHYYHELPYPT